MGNETNYTSEGRNVSMRKNIGLHFAFPALLLVTACGSSVPYVTQEAFEARMAVLEEQNEELNNRVDSVRECEEWRTAYIREGIDCINGLQITSLMRLSAELGEEPSEQMVYERRVRACLFACSFEQLCEHGTHEVCGFVEEHRGDHSSTEDETVE